MIAIARKTVTTSVAVLLASCAVAPSGKPADGGEAVVSTNVVLDSLLLPGLAVADRLGSGLWPEQARLDELLKCAHRSSVVCDLTIIASTADEYRIDYSLAGSLTDQCSYAFATEANRLDRDELCFELSVWPTASETEDQVSDLEKDVICASDTSVPFPWRVLFAGLREVPSEASQRVQERLRRLLNEAQTDFEPSEPASQRLTSSCSGP